MNNNIKSPISPLKGSESPSIPPPINPNINTYSFHQKLPGDLKRVLSERRAESPMSLTPSKRRGNSNRYDSFSSYRRASSKNMREPPPGSVALPINGITERDSRLSESVLNDICDSPLIQSPKPKTPLEEPFDNRPILNNIPESKFLVYEQPTPDCLKEIDGVDVIYDDYPGSPVREERSYTQPQELNDEIYKEIINNEEYDIVDEKSLTESQNIYQNINLFENIDTNYINKYMKLSSEQLESSPQKHNFYQLLNNYRKAEEDLQVELDELHHLRILCEEDFSHFWKLSAERHTIPIGSCGCGEPIDVELSDIKGEYDKKIKDHCINILRLMHKERANSVYIILLYSFTIYCLIKFILIQ